MTDPLQKLFGSAARIKLLRLFVFNPREAFAAAEAARRAQVGPAAARQEFALFVQAGLIKRAGRRAGYYMLAQDFEYLEALQGLLLNAPKMGGKLYERLRGAGTVRLIIAAGIFAGNWDGRLDLLVVGDRIDDRKIRTRMRNLESDLGREVRYAVLATNDFFYRLNMSDKLLRDVMDYEHVIVHDRLNIGLK
ncbi:MAG: hypothetical protein V4474_02655 [Patescibacteria group bacterium]